jgi:hypothetical protein
MHNVAKQKSKKDALRITISADKMRKIQKGVERQERKEAGALVISGAGVHGGNHDTQNRRDRRDSKKELKRYGRGARDDD